MPKSRLSDSDRTYFELLARGAFSNPFDGSRGELDRQIAGLSAPTPDDEMREHVVSGIRQRVAALEAGGRADLRRYTGDDQDLFKYAVLSLTYYTHLLSMDRLIDEQVRAGDEGLPVPFAEEAIAALCGWGMTIPVACSYFAMLFQFRRAFYFIDRDLVGRSACMKALRAHLWNNVFTQDRQAYERYLWNRMEDFSTLVLGETGTGKGSVASAIGRSGFIPFDHTRKRFTTGFTSAFITLNLSQFSEALIESELFGHRKGAFTGAIDHHEGALARCRPGGVIFLDEIGEVSTPVQIKLLRVLQERVFTPVGSHEQVRFRGRVIAATNRDLGALRRTTLRDDFYYRLCSDVITVPSLRRRLAEDPGEFAELLGHILKRMVGEAAPDLAGQVAEVLTGEPGLDYAWPGNVRELEQAVRRVLLTGAYHGAPPAIPDLRARLHAELDAGRWKAHDLLAVYCRLLHAELGTYGAVAARVDLDWRTVKKFVESGAEPAGAS